MTHLPKKVNVPERGMVKSPVTQVADVAVKKRSIHDKGTIRDIGSARSNVPTQIVKKKEKNIIRAGEYLDRFTSIS